MARSSVLSAGKPPVIVPFAIYPAFTGWFTLEIRLFVSYIYEKNIIRMLGGWYGCKSLESRQSELL